jgi:hypothetical protein
MVTIHYIRLNEILVTMVSEKRITNDEREELLHKSGLLKLEGDLWRQDEYSVLTLTSPETI